MKQWINKATAIALSGLMLASCLTGCGAQQTVKTAPVSPEAETDAVTDAAIRLLGSHSDTAGKEETVYVIADAAGNPTETIVSAWLKNPDGADTLSDHAELTDIRNVKGDETFTAGEDGAIVWQANGNDIHYQGTTDQQLPVTAAITYELDGREVPAQELAGATGHLTVTFRYTNHTATERTVNGKTVTLYQPFLVVSGLMLDDANAAHVTVTNGKVIHTGDRTVAVGMAMPGLRESLGLDGMRDQKGNKLDLEVPETVVIEADVADFTLLTTVTVIENSLLQNLDLSNVRTVSDLEGALNRLTDASTRLVEGSGALYDGVSALQGGASRLTDGIVQLDNGAGDLADGAKQLSDGARQTADGAAALSDGAKALSDGNAALRDGAEQLDAGAKALSDGADKAAQGAGTLSGGAKALAGGAAAVSENMDALSDGLGTLSGGAAQVSDGLARLQSQVAGLPEGVQALYNGLLQVRQALKGQQGSSVYEGAVALQQGAAALSAGLVSGDAANPGICEGAAGMKSGAAAIRTGADQIAAAAAQVQSGIDRIPGQVAAAAASASGGLQAASGQLTAIVNDENLTDEQRAAIQTALGYISAVDDGLGSVSVDLTQADAALTAIAGGANAISSGADKLQSGADRISAGASALNDGAKRLESGAGRLAGGVEQIVSDENLGAIIGGVSALADSSQTLVGGVDQLSDGAKAVAGGASTAASGARELAAGSHTLSDSSAQLRDGAAALAGGVAELSGGAKMMRSSSSEWRSTIALLVKCL